MRAGVLLLVFAVFVTLGQPFYVGTGRYDITGPAAGINMMGYANPEQISAGLHLRQWSRAFIFSESATSGPRTVFVNLDTCMATQIMKLEIVKQLQGLYGGIYTDENVCISGIHTHSGPGGYWQYLLYEVTSLGFVEDSLDVVVNGVVESIKMAHENMQEASLLTSVGTLTNASINRSPYAYEQNPDKANYSANVDQEMFVLKMINNSKDPLGMISWFAVHCTSMNNTNEMISADNKGYASYLMEHTINKALPGEGAFVGAFAQSNEGDVSPNTKGPICVNSGQQCDYKTSTCDGRNENCIAFGPGKDMIDSTRIIGENQFYLGQTLFNNASDELSGPIDYRHTYLDMSQMVVKLDNGSEVHTCSPAMGYSFAAGTTDGPGAFNFEQADNNSTGYLFWNLVRDLLATPSKEQEACQYPKPILLDTANMTFPYLWTPSIVPIQIFRIGQLFLLAVPGEFSTMSGRRLRNSVKETLQANGIKGEIKVVIAGLANTYSDYITTPEEYEVQRYEGASTIFGKFTLPAYIQEFNKLAKALATGQSVDPGPSPPNMLNEQWSLVPPVLFDGVPLGKKFGDVVTDVQPSYARGTATVTVVFRAGNPRNNLMTGKSFLTVEQETSDGNWQVLYTDASWETRFRWKHTSELLQESEATIEWVIPANAPLGTYRIQHFGYHKELDGKINPYSGVSSQFQVTG